MNNHSHFAKAALVCLVAAFAPALPAQAADGDGWDWMVAPYLWAAGIATDVETDRPPLSASSDKAFDDVIDKLDGAFQIHVEGHGDHVGLFADFTYLGLADSHDFERFSTESDLDTRLFEAAAVWNPGDARSGGLGLFAGLRYIDVDFTLQLDPVNPDFDGASVHNDQSFSDLMLGARYTWVMSDRWWLTLRGDTSFGDTEGTWNASGVVQYRTKHGAWLFGYRYLDVGLEPEDTRLDITMSGLEIGYGFRF